MRVHSPFGRRLGWGAFNRKPLPNPLLAGEGTLKIDQNQVRNYFSKRSSE